VDDVTDTVGAAVTFAYVLSGWICLTFMLIMIFALFPYAVMLLR